MVGRQPELPGDGEIGRGLAPPRAGLAPRKAAGKNQERLWILMRQLNAAPGMLDIKRRLAKLKGLQDPGVIGRRIRGHGGSTFLERSVTGHEDQIQELALHVRR